MTRIAAAVIAAWFAGTVVAADAYAGASSYDVSAVMAEPHPFANTPSAVPEVGTPRYESQIRAPAYPAVPRETAEAGQRDRMGIAAAPETRRSDDPSFLTIGAGYYDFNDNEHAAEFRLEWRGRQWKWGIRPFAGVMATSDSAAFGYGGILFDLFFGRRIVVSPSFAPGLYHNGDGKDLGSVIEFRSAIEIGWRFDDRSRLSAMVYHISNAGIDHTNPGTEVVSFGYSIPLN